MNILSADQISKAYADKILFEHVSLGLSQGQKVALIGVNGSGKSTLLKVLAGIITPDSGSISLRKGIKVAYLPQDPDLPLAKTVSEVVFSTDLPALNAIREYEQLIASGKNDAVSLNRLQELTQQIEALGAWNVEIEIQQILGKLQVDFLDRPIAQLSGGQRKRVALAQALVEQPDLIIMDEPTNHLDLESIEWLEKFLSTSKQTLLLVTHDRYFLDNITEEIIELDQRRIFRYEGNYAYYLEKRAERDLSQDKNLEKARNLYKKELEWLRRSPKARGTKSKSRIDAAQDLHGKTIDRRDDKEIQLQVKGRRIGGKVLEIKRLKKAYGDLRIVDDFTYTFNRRDRIGIVGPNGVGKTTFLNLLMGIESPDAGKINKGETIVFGYYTQAGWTFKDNQRVIEVVTEAAETVELSKNQTLSAAQLLEHFLFPRNQHHALVETLSGGERRRLHLLRILMTNPNFLILDEPTNDLDLITLRKLEHFLDDFEGCLMIVSHDRYFMDRLVDHTFLFRGEGIIKDFPGSYSQLRIWETQQKAAQSLETGSTKTQKTASTPTATNQAPQKKKKLSYNEQREYTGLENEIEQLERKKAELHKLLGSGESDYSKLTSWTQELEALEVDLETKSNRWLELAEILEG